MTKENIPVAWIQPIGYVITLVVVVTGTWFTFPQKMSAETDTKLQGYVRKDVHDEQQKHIEDKLTIMLTMIKDIQKRVK